MIKCGLKLWSSNVDLFAPAVDLFARGKIDFLELYHDDSVALDYEALKQLTALPVNIHNTDNLGFERFLIGEAELALWEKTKNLADFFTSEFIIVHPGREHSFATFQKNLRLINHPKILIENMPGLDVLGQTTYASRLDELEKIKQIKGICYDFEKAAKAAARQAIQYKDYIAESLLQLRPEYFHLSGGDVKSPVDQHLDLWEGGLDIRWVKKAVEDLASDRPIGLVFETPKKDGLMNDLKNIEYFKSL